MKKRGENLFGECIYGFDKLEQREIYLIQCFYSLRKYPVRVCAGDLNQTFFTYKKPKRSEAWRHRAHKGTRVPMQSYGKCNPYMKPHPYTVAQKY